MDSNAIKICVRVRPWHEEKERPFVIQPVNQTFFLGDGAFTQSPRKPLGGSLKEVVEVMDHRQLDFDKPEFGSETKRGQPGAKRYKNRRYVFDHVFRMDASQEAVFDHTAKPLLEGIMDGYNATVFAYGATGCGKTHTISGSVTDPGITIRIMRELFEMIEASKDEFDTYIELSMVEIYNELIRDLLNDDFPNCPRGGLKLLENEKERVTLDRVTLKKPKSVEEVMEWVLMGNQRRSTSFTASNSESSRSHAVLQINVGRNNRGHEVDFEQNVVRQCTSSATLSIIDLAGSERAAATRNMGARMKEGANINKSLLALSSCISALCQRPLRGLKPHVPYRNSKLTRMLKFSLGGNCRTVMVVCVSPSSKDIEDTHNTLVWADKAKNVSTKISRNTAGNHISVQQYLVTIDQQQQKIRLLEASIQKLEQSGNAGPSGWALKKLESAREDAHVALDKARQDVEITMSAITEGSTQHALREANQIRASALELSIARILSSPNEYSPEETAILDQTFGSLIKQQNAAWCLDRNMEHGINNQVKTMANLDRGFRALEEKTFGDALDKRELRGYRSEVFALRASLDVHVAASREAGYRQALQSQVDAFAKTVERTCRTIGRIINEADRIHSSMVAGLVNEPTAATLDQIQQLGAIAMDAIASLVEPSSCSSSPPAPRSLTDATPTSQLFAEGHTASPPRPAVTRPDPARRRLLATAQKPTSPARQPARQFRVGHLSARATKKSFRWKDEAGEGQLEDKLGVPRCASDSADTAAFFSLISLDDSEADPSDNSMRSSESSSMLTARTSQSVRPPTKSPSSLALPLPDWKKNRLILGKLPASSLSTLGEESEGKDEILQRKSNIARESLSPLKTLLPLPTAARSNLSSGFSRPTLASSSKITDSVSEAVKLGPPSRRSSIAGRSGPSRRMSTNEPYTKAPPEVRRARPSLLPPSGRGSDEALLDTSRNLGNVEGLTKNPARLVSPSTNGAGGRKIVPPAISGYSPKNGPPSSLTRRSSLMPSPTSSAVDSQASRFRKAPRASMSVATFARPPGSALHFGAHLRSSSPRCQD